MARPLTISLTLLSFVALQLAPAACGSSEEAGLKVTIFMESPLSPPITSGERRLTTDLGYAVRLTRGYLSYQSVELSPCAGAAWRRSGWIREAHAHGETSPTRLGLARIESLLTPPGMTDSLGELAPPPGRYCSVILGLHAADEDASGLPEDKAVLGKSVLVEGFYTPPGGDAEVAFVGSTSASASVTSAIGSLDLSEGGTHEAAITITAALEHLLDGVELNASTEEQIGRGILNNLGAVQGARLQ